MNKIEELQNQIDILSLELSSLKGEKERLELLISQLERQSQKLKIPVDVNTVDALKEALSIEKEEGLKGYFYLSSDYTYTDYKYEVKVPIDSSLFNSGLTFDSTNHKIIIPQTGYYFVSVLFRGENNSDNRLTADVRLKASGTIKAEYRINSYGISYGWHSASFGILLPLSKDDYLELFYQRISGDTGKNNTFAGGSEKTYITILSI